MEDNKDIKSQATIEVTDEGPIRITGNIVIQDMKRGNEDKSREVLLCGCGKSGNKPYCDDSHKRI